MSRGAEVIARLAEEDAAAPKETTTEEPADDGAGADPHPPEGTRAGGESPADSSAADKDKPKEGAEKAPKEPEKKPEEKPDAKAFLALTKGKQRLREREEEHGRQVATFNQRVQGLQQYEAQVKQREVEASKRVEEIADKLRTPDGFFAMAEEAGIAPELVAAWVKGEKRAAPKPPAKTDTLTRAEFEAWQRDVMAETARRDAENARVSAEREFHTVMRGAEDKYEAALTIYSDEERARIGHIHADKAKAKGLRWSLEDIAESVNELAEQDPRWTRILAKRSGSAQTPGKGTAPTKAGGGAAPTKAEGRTISNDLASSPTSDSTAIRRKHANRVDSLIRKLE